jgi:hypothetical protein
MSRRNESHARLPVAVVQSHLAPLLQRAFMPFRAGTQVTRDKRLVIAACWGVAGVLFACIWTGALALLMPGFSGVRAITVAVLLVLGAGVFFAAAGYALVGIGNALVARQQPRSSRPPDTHAP